MSGNLEDRKICAEFEFPQYKWEIYPDAVRRFTAGGAYGIEWVPAKHYESDPAAACSLLPKLAPLLSDDYTTENPADQRSQFVDELGDALMDGNGSEVCRLVVEAVKAVRRAKDGGR